MFENTKDFYPTPYNLIEKMLSTVNFYMIKSILEPSAGKGDIVDAIFTLLILASGVRMPVGTRNLVLI